MTEKQRSKIEIIKLEIRISVARDEKFYTWIRKDEIEEQQFKEME